jgi:hypothetical protein
MQKHWTCWQMCLGQAATWLVDQCTFRGTKSFFLNKHFNISWILLQFSFSWTWRTPASLHYNCLLFSAHTHNNEYICMLKLVQAIWMLGENSPYWILKHKIVSTVTELFFTYLITACLLLFLGKFINYQSRY